MERRVIKAHAASYPTPIRVAKGDPLTLSGREDIWDGHRWLWAAAQGREGWVPDDLPDAEGRAARDYSAMELSAAQGDRVTVLSQSHGWALCRLGAREGWLPLSHIAAP